MKLYFNISLVLKGGFNKMADLCKHKLSAVAICTMSRCEILRVCTSTQGWLLIGYPKKTTKGIEVRITEWLPGNEYVTRHEFNQALGLFTQKFKPAFSRSAQIRIEKWVHYSFRPDFCLPFPSGPGLHTFPWQAGSKRK